ncbi:MAG: hypothetical protein EB051_02880 [Chlamydiia bacterium]|nr:hypothetical protein [Chlamydiia bacterium]
MLPTRNPTSQEASNRSRRSSFFSFMPTNASRFTSLFRSSTRRSQSTRPVAQDRVSVIAVHQAPSQGIDLPTENRTTTLPVSKGSSQPQQGHFKAPAVLRPPLRTYKAQKNAQEYLIDEQKDLLDQLDQRRLLIKSVIDNPSDHYLIPELLRSIICRATEKPWSYICDKLSNPHSPIFHPEARSLLDQLNQNYLENIEFHHMSLALLYLEIVSLRYDESMAAARDFILLIPPPAPILRRIKEGNADMLLQPGITKSLEKTFQSLREQARIKISRRYELLMQVIVNSKHPDVLTQMAAPSFLLDERTNLCLQNSITGLENLGKHDCWINSWVQLTSCIRSIYTILDKVVGLAAAVRDPSLVYLRQIKTEVDCFIEEKSRPHPPKISRANTTIIRHALHELFQTSISNTSDTEDDPANIIELLYSLYDRIATAFPFTDHRDTIGLEQTVIYPIATQEITQPNTEDIADSDLPRIYHGYLLPEKQIGPLLSLNPHATDVASGTIGADGLLRSAFIESIRSYSDPRLDLTDPRDTNGAIKLKQFTNPIRVIYRFNKAPDELCFRVLPHVVTKGLAWTHNSRTDVIHHPLPIPDRFTLSADLTGEIDTTYELQAFIKKSGGSDSGHYIIYQKDHDGRWHLCSDRITYPIPEQQRQFDALPYSCMVFYRKLSQVDPLSIHITSTANIVATQPLTDTSRAESLPHVPLTPKRSLIIEWLNSVWARLQRAFNALSQIWQGLWR